MAKVAVVTKSPRISKKYGWAEGSFKTKRAVTVRLNWMDVPAKRRPRGF